MKEKIQSKEELEQKLGTKTAKDSIVSFMERTKGTSPKIA
jgi:hypothetical protein